MPDPKFDDLFFAVLNNVGGIDKFLDTMFSFLYRRTDFFRVKSSNAEKLGLPPGLAQKMVKVLCQKYVELGKPQSSPCLEPSADQESEHGEKTVKTEGKTGKTSQKPTQIKQTEDDSTSGKVAASLHDHDLPKEGSIQEPEEKPVKAAREVEEKSVEIGNETKEGPVETTTKSEDLPAKTAEDEDAERRYYESNPECYNGASYDNYCWSQSNFDLDVQVKVPNCVKTSDKVKVLIMRKQLKVEVLQDENWQVVLDGAFLYDVKLGGSTWSLHPSDHIHINLEKGYPRYWEALLEGEPKINVRTIDCSIPFEDIEEEAQAKLHQMMFDQHQKRLGKPTSEQIKVQEMLEKAWNKDGSPFKGQKYDPTHFNVAQ